jgi:tetratricopeptide (TPR) repeat protein
MIELLLQARRADEAGQVDEAERRYRQVLAADPRNVIALVALARLARRRGDDAAAEDLARTTLGIDPDNVGARRELDSAGTAVPARIEEAPADREPSGEPAADWPWPDLDQQLERYRPRRNPISRLLGRGRRESDGQAERGNPRDVGEPGRG